MKVELSHKNNGVRIYLYDSVEEELAVIKITNEDFKKFIENGEEFLFYSRKRHVWVNDKIRNKILKKT